jgi:small subunit ribosomal protein S6
MPLYEHVFLARQDVSAQQVETLVEQYKGLIEGAGGTIGKVENWGLRTLAYRIKKNRKAHYTLMNITAPHAAVAEMERQMGLRRRSALHDLQGRRAGRRAVCNDAEA